MEEFFHHLLHALTHTLEHTWYVLPVLFLIYFLIETIEHKAMDKVRSVRASKSFGIVGGSAVGLFPTCGFSVAAANLYSERLISAGTVAAVFVATSDEAFPIMLTNSESVKWFLPMLGIKLVYAVIAGFVVSGIFKLTKLDKLKPQPHHHGHSDEHRHEGGEHHHCSHCDSNRGILSATVKRTVSVFLFVFVIGLLLNFAIELLGEDRLSAVLMNDSVFQPFIAALIGLIPNCASSVVTTELFVSGALSFGSLAAALSAGAGIGMLVLFRVNRNYKQNFAMLGLLYLLSAILGIIINFIV